MQKYSIALAVAVFASLGALMMPSGRAENLPNIDTCQRYIVPIYRPMSDLLKASESERAADRRYYWFSVFEGWAQFFWDDWEVSEDEYRRNASPDDVAYLDAVLSRSNAARS
jgi:hypothetical protein